MGYYEFKIKTSPQAKDVLCGQLFSDGCLGVIDSANELIAYYGDTLGIEAILRQLEQTLDKVSHTGLQDKFAYSYQYLGERDWNESWKKKFKPLTVGQSIVILPPWLSNDTQRLAVIIDPAMAFGTGHHETTKNCIQYIEMLCLSGEVCKGKVLDFGSGTGILAITALKLGFGSAICIDIDPLAIDAVKRNAQLNNLANLHIAQSSIDAIRGKFDLITANLMSEVLIQNASTISSALDPKGKAILSGMIVGQELDVINAITDAGLQVIDSCLEGRWVTLLCAYKG